MATLNDRDHFKAWVPFGFDLLEKSGPAGAPTRGRIKGILSSENTDADDEVVVQAGMDFDFFLKGGKITYGHPATPANIIGEPISIALTKLEDDVPATELVADLFLTDALAKTTWEKAHALHKAGARTGLGWSIEGYATKRDPDNPKRILTSVVTSAAIDPSPKNTDSYLDVIAASMGARIQKAGYASLSAWAEAGCPLADEPTSPPLSIVPATDAGIRQLLIKGLTDEDLLVARTSKRFPTLSRFTLIDLVQGVLASQQRRAAA